VIQFDLLGRVFVPVSKGTKLIEIFEEIPLLIVIRPSRKYSGTFCVAGVVMNCVIFIVNDVSRYDVKYTVYAIDGANFCRKTL